jgi:hypothetical protein
VTGCIAAVDEVLAADGVPQDAVMRFQRGRDAAGNGLRNRLIAAQLPAAKLTTALGAAPQVTGFDLLTSLDG